MQRIKIITQFQTLPILYSLMFIIQTLPSVSPVDHYVKDSTYDIHSVNN